MGKYIPPHLRKDAPQRPAIPDVPRMTLPLIPSLAGMELKYSTNAINKLYMLSPTDKGLQFRIVDGYCCRLSVVPASAQPQHSDFHGALGEGIAGSGLADSFQGRRLRRNLEQDLKAALEEMSSSCADTTASQTGRRLRPLLWLRFGRLTFYSGRGGPDSLKALPSFSYTELEDEFERGLPKRWPTRPFKVLDTNLPRSYFDRLKEVACRSQEDRAPVEKEGLVVEVVKRNWKHALLVQCKAHGESLTIVKCRRRPIRYLVTDLSRATEWDLRIMLSTHVVEGDDSLSDDERRTAEDTVKGAIIDHNTELGIRWASPLSGADTNESGNSGLVKRRVRTQRQTKFFSRGIVWKFIERAADSEGSTSFEVDLRLVSWKSFLKDNKDRIGSARDLLDSTFDILSWIWSHCL